LLIRSSPFQKGGARMKIIVLNGSPKGLTSITMQSIHFIQKKFPEHELEIINISKRIDEIRGDNDTFSEIIDKIKTSDGVLWATPIYFFIVPYQYKAFIELVMEKDAINAFKDKYAAVITTSVHVMDHVGHNYLHAICDDLFMKFLGSFSADMNDLLESKERERLFLFAQYFFDGIVKNIPTSKHYEPLKYSTINYESGPIKEKVDVANKKFVILTDSDSDNSSLSKMTNTIMNAVVGDVEMINLHNIDIRNGCQGCYLCAYDNTCRFENKDEFVRFFNNKIQPAQILLFCGTVRDRYLSSRWKLFFDRTFFKQHIPYLKEKQVGFLISGPLKQNPNLRQMLEAYCDLMGANLVDIVTDEHQNSEIIDGLLSNLANNLVHFAKNGYASPPRFYSVGTMKIFRDLFWGKFRFVCQADHKFYKKNSIYDFPQKNYKDRVLNTIVIPLTRIPKMRKKLYNNLREEIIKPHQKVLREISV
jgi:multimeric flavodoxin WrbA